ncbi:MULTISPECIES: substrate-binding periplasmic protein [unclassified Pseudoalteromonas]|uniref:substrate-binding periplasmic protein n=1 Tax=unclassified Pseudoalteromonas TaxID=194690 RepID=UPI00041D92AB|nr:MULTISPECIES: transporter substrate-binding domain-containing protein [unclassified Pseudoalteromonas]MDC9522283.1 transporter substrate-binding domain-containing protein [Pseudoalteromonas sp. Angola-31]MDC9496303.1 transporter substrate-binding domain-containing protein [Pseudoalteromonas sp. Angola-20]MDC9517963.1 transporter substrate-binding domain-containing protein [Pseudoalteromonas sp. Angola-22]MDC9534378.1 transporter substrate-binding domain-containing protein [Pseudoalteromonas 
MRTLLLLLAFSFSSLLLAAPNKTLRCATTHYPPFTIYDDETHTFTGIDIDYLAFIERNLNLNIEVVHLPWARIKKEMTLGYYDCYFALANNTERAQYLEFTTEPLHTTQFGLFSTQKANLNNDLSNSRIAMLRGVKLPSVLAKEYNIKQSNFMHSLSTKATFDLLNKQRVDYAITNYQAGLWYSKGYKNIYAKQLEGYALPVYIAFKHGMVDTALVDEQIKRYKAQFGVH